MMKAADIRQQFLDFFKEKGHTIVPSAPIVVKNDPTLMFTNAGMNQFKDYFLGNKPIPYNRVADTQKCLRVSGKHNDLEEVGVDTYHHTMFEMLGNWSFGDPKNPSAGYFKKEAIAWSWELLTEIFGIPKDRLYVTIFGGDKEEGLERDNESAQIWEEVIKPGNDKRIIACSKKDNFWEMGDTGPCGPCTEVHVDCRPDEERKQVDGYSLVNNDHPQVIEIWNNVFIQYNRKKDGSLEPLPAKHVDTGMGFERLVRVLQQKTSNYDTDIFSGTIAATEKITGKKYTQGDDKESVAFRVIADHIRAVAFTIADGQLPSNTGAGYVIRRVLRRAVRYYYSYLGYRQPMLCQLVPVLAKQFENVFPELQQQVDFVTKVVKEEEDAFLRTLDKGLKRLEDYFEIEKNKIYTEGHENHPSVKDIWITNMDESNNREELKKFAAENENKIKNIIFDGKLAFELYDTFGFPIDLTRLIVKENNYGFTNWSIDEAGFEAEMKKQKERSRAATALDTEDWIELQPSSKTSFVGYDKLSHETNIVKYRTVKGKGKTAYQIVLAETPFYAESGGQVGDTGKITIGGNDIDIYDTKKENDLIIHFAESIPAELNGAATASVNSERRKAICLHHSVTHLMHAALRKVLGTHVAQKGSLVNDEYLRFDFSHFAKVTDEEIAAVEKLVNEKIRENIPVVIKEMPKDEALKLGAMALFGEKYGDTVRVVMIDPGYSVELCGGTHVGATGEIGLFKIISESAVAAGVRRVEAVSGAAAEQYVATQLSLLNGIKQQFKNPKDLAKAAETLQQENASLKKHIENLEARQLVVIRNGLLQKDEIINNVTFIGDMVEVGNADALKKLCFDMKNHLHDYVTVLCANIGGKPFVAIGIAETVAAAKNLDAGKLIKEVVAPLIKGGGGGQKTLATAGGQEVSGLPSVIEKIKSLI